MRLEFSKWLEQYLGLRADSVFLTGDLGFNAFENVKKNFSERFINVGVAEQNMIGIAAGMAQQNLVPICYSIAPFLVFRPYEQIRLDVCIHNMNVKLVGNGGGYGYGIMGATHHALEDIAVLSCLPKMQCFIPFCDEDVFQVADAMMDYEGPSYLRLNSGSLKPFDVELPEFAQFRKISDGDDLVCICFGPIGLNLLQALYQKNIRAKIFVVSVMPILSLSEEFLADVKDVGKLLIVEEHSQRGGFGENIIYQLAKANCGPEFRHVFANGYQSGLYGSQRYHQKECGLDAEGLGTMIEKWLKNGK